MKRFFMVIVFSLLGAGTLYSAEWGAEGTTAVVNPPVRSPLEVYQSLSGEWEFSTGFWFLRWHMGKDEPSAYDGVGKAARTILVPGCWEAQGVGEPGPNQTWDCKWDCYNGQLRHKYMGPANYEKTIDVPADWSGKQVWLKIGGVRSEAYIWINNRKAAYVNNYCGTYKYNVTNLLEPSKPARIVAFVRNDTPSRKGLLSVVHAFGGFYRDIELEATPNVWIDDLWTRSVVQGESGVCQLQCAVSRADAAETKPYAVRYTILDKTGQVVEKSEAPVAVAFEESGKTANLSIKTKNPLKLWSPEQPNLYVANVELLDGSGTAIHGWTQRFGVRELKAVGKQFYLNGKPYFLRGCGDHNYNILNLIDKPDREHFVKQLKLMKAAGFNFTRHHTHCPLPEYFDAADEVGLLLMPELPYYHDVPTEGFQFDPMRDIKELCQTHRRNVSFAAYSTGNEGFLGDGLDVEIYKWVKQNDPERIMQHQDGGKNTADNSDFYSPNGYGLHSSIDVWGPGAFDQVDKPFVAHEYLNLAVKPNPYLEQRYTGVQEPPRTLESYRKELQANGLDETWGRLCIAAGERLQMIYQKKGLEQARLDPACDGYGYWSISDAGAASQGYLTQFYELRDNSWKPEQFRDFNGPTALLLKTMPNKRIAVAGEKRKIAVWISHFDAQEIPAGTCSVTLGGKTVATLEHKSIPVGYVGPIAEAEIVVPAFGKSAAVELETRINAPTLAGKPRTISNRWPFWVFPVREKPSLKGVFVELALYDWFKDRYADVTPINLGDKSETARLTENDLVIAISGDPESLLPVIQQGARILAITPASDQPDVRLGWWWLGSQIGTAFADHPAFADFPNAPYMDELWFGLIRKGAHDLRSTTPFGKLAPLAVGEGQANYNLYLGETKIGKARVLVSFALALEQDAPEALALLDGFIRYAQSDKFNPTVENGTDELKGAAPDGMTLGYKRVLDHPQSMVGPTYSVDNAWMYYCRQDRVNNALRWETTITPQDGDAPVTFVFAGGLGYISQPKTDGFELSVNGKPVLIFDLPKTGEKSAVWKSPDGQVELRFEIIKVESNGQDFLGKFFLTVDRKRVTGGQSAVLSVKSLGAGSLRWFALEPRRNLK